MSINNRFMTPDKWYRSFFILSISIISLFFLFPMRSFANEAQNGNVVFTKEIYHRHTGSSGSGGGCYSIRRSGTKTEGCYGGAQCDRGPNGPDTSGQVYYIGNCEVCGARVSKYNSAGYKHCDATRTVSYTYYDLGCNQFPSTMLGVLSVVQDTSEWTKEVTLSASYEITGNMNVKEMPYVWNGEEPTFENTYLVTDNGEYSLQLNADDNADTNAGKIVIPIRNIDITAPVITSHTLEPESGWVGEGVLMTVGEIQDLQPDNTPGCGLHELAYSYDNGETWIAETSHFYEESGVYTVMVRDALENVSSYEFSFYHVDNMPPTIETIEYDDTPNVLSTALTVTASDIQADGSDGCGLHEQPYSFDGGNTWTDIPVWETDRNGIITVAVRDVLNNIAYQEVAITNIDGLGPKVSYYINPDSWTNRDVYLRLSAQDINADKSPGIGLPDAWYSLDGGGTWEHEEEQSFSQNRKMTLIARDKYGNLTYTDISITCIDKDFPWVSLYMEVTGEGKEQIVTLIADGGDSGSGLHEQAYSWDNGGSYANEKRKTVTENGIYEVIVRDKAGNRCHEQIEVTVFEEPVEEIIPVIEVIEPTYEEETVIQTEEETEEQKEDEPVIIKAAPKADTAPVREIRVVEEDTWELKDTLAVIGISTTGLGLLFLLLFYMMHTVAVYMEDEKENMRYLGRLWIHHREDGYEVRFTEAWMEKCVTTHFCLKPSLLFLIKRKDATLSLLFPEDICITLAVSKEMDFSLL